MTSQRILTAVALIHCLALYGYLLHNVISEQMWTLAIFIVIGILLATLIFIGYLRDLYL